MPKTVNIRFRLTNAQRLVVTRRREGQSQTEAAKSWGVSFKMYRKWESGKVVGPYRKIGHLLLHERCFLLRREAGELQKNVAKKIGVSRFWLRQMECGEVPCKRLVEYWNGRSS